MNYKLKKVMRKFIGILSISVSVIAVTILTITREEPETEKKEIEKSIEVSILDIKQENVTDMIKGYGQVRARWKTTLASEVRGRVLSVSEKLFSGAQFNKGEVLATIDNTTYEVELADAEAALAKANRILKEEEERSKVAADEWDIRGYARKPSNLVLRKPHIQEARAAVKSAKVKIKKAKYDLTQTRITAPYDGIVIERNINPGDFLQVGIQIAKIYERGIYEIAIPLNGNEIQRLPANSKGVTIRLYSEHTDKVWDGKISRLEQVIDNQNRWQNIIIEIIHTTGLLPGQFLTAEIPGKNYNNILAIPENVLSDDGHIWFVNEQDHLQKFKANILFHKSGSIYVHSPAFLHTSTRITAEQDFFLEGIKVAPTFEIKKTTRAIVTNMEGR